MKRKDKYRVTIPTLAMCEVTLEVTEGTSPIDVIRMAYKDAEESPVKFRRFLKGREELCLLNPKPTIEQYPSLSKI